MDLDEQLKQVLAAKHRELSSSSDDEIRDALDKATVKPAAAGPTIKNGLNAEQALAGFYPPGPDMANAKALPYSGDADQLAKIKADHVELAGYPDGELAAAILNHKAYLQKYRFY